LVLVVVLVWLFYWRQQTKNIFRWDQPHVFFVTGAASGIGARMVYRLLEKKAKSYRHGY